MSIYLSEDEQIDAIKKFWNRYGNIISTFIMVLVLVIAGHQWWDRRQNMIAQSASATYEQVIVSLSTHDTSTARIAAETILTKFPNTVYAQMSDLLLARMDMDKHDSPAALKDLDGVIQHGKTTALQQIARIRTAKILLAQQKPEQALQTLAVVANSSFAAMTQEVQGDCYRALKDPAKARLAYQAALAATAQDAPIRVLLEMKLADLPGEKS